MFIVFMFAFHCTLYDVIHISALHRWAFYIGALNKSSITVPFSFYSSPVSTTRVDGPLTRAVNSGSGNRVSRCVLPTAVINEDCIVLV